MNSIPFDPEKRMITSGIRLGSAAATTRGFAIAEFQQTGRLIVEVLDGLQGSPDDNRAVEHHVRAQVEELCAAFPIYQMAETDTRFAKRRQACQVDRLATTSARPAPG
jgi:glycine hydroxymethyltransferase